MGGQRQQAASEPGQVGSLLAEPGRLHPPTVDAERLCHRPEQFLRMERYIAAQSRITIGLAMVYWCTCGTHMSQFNNKSTIQYHYSTSSINSH